MPNRDIEAILKRLAALHPKLIDLALDRIARLLADLGHPERALPPVAHIAGTNGKGSTLAYLRAMAEAAGMRVHVYTSPHLVRFNERIRIAGRLIEDEELADLLEECERVNAGKPITFFEITNAAAFLAFSRHPADLCLIETGMGGEFDSTNVIERPALTLITTVAFDHMAYLGDTLAKIAKAKAGILKPGVVCVAAAQAPEALGVIEARAKALAAPVLLEGRDWSAEPAGDGMRVRVGATALDLPRPALGGAHQIHNAGLAAVAARELNARGALPRPIEVAAIAAGLRGAEWPARMQRLNRGPLADSLPPGWELWLDGAHNPAAAAALAKVADDWDAAWPMPLDLVVGMLDTKDAAGFLAPLAGRVRHLRAVTISGETHASPAESLAAVARRAGLDARAAASVDAALRDLITAATPGSARVLICGSLYLAGAVLGENG